MNFREVNYERENIDATPDPLALIIVTLLPIVSAQALSDDATTTIGRHIQSEVEINLESSEQLTFK